jgi:peptidoglycan/LPS O-acetylase OafA/YrhL
MAFQSIYFFRFLAALVVVVYHFAPEKFSGVSISFFKSHGYEPVNFFFFLSGFILTHAYKGKVDSFSEYKKYLFNRWSKIYPVYLFALIITFSVNYEVFSNTRSFYLRFLLETTMLQSWCFKTALNFPDWSLSCELLFYITFPFFLNLIIKSSRRKSLFMTICFYAITISLCLGFIGKINNLEYFPITHLSTFILGILSYKLCIVDNVVKSPNGPLILVLSLVSLTFYFVDIFEIMPNHNNGILVPIYFVLIPLIVSNEIFNRLIGNKFFILLGKASYSLYIFQYPVWLIFLKIGYLKEVMSKGELFVLYIIVLILFSLISFVLLERPIEKKLRSYFVKYIL